MGGGSQICLGSNDSQINPHMGAKCGRDPTVVSKKRGVQTDTDKGKLQLYIVDVLCTGNNCVTKNSYSLTMLR